MGNIGNYATTFHNSKVDFSKLTAPIDSSLVVENHFSNHKTQKTTNKKDCTASTPPKPSEDCIKHEFIWKYGGTQVVLTGSFDNWSQSIQMKKDSTESGVFRKTLWLDPHKSWTFKFIVDGIWRCSLDFPTESDSVGNVNNILTQL